VGIGGALAEARSEAGMTVTEVSERTRIRATIIRDIERDDYGSCGGDYYARGHIRAIARVVGTDPVPLIQEYDAARLPPSQPAGFSETDRPAQSARTADQAAPQGPGPAGPGRQRGNLWHTAADHPVTGTSALHDDAAAPPAGREAARGGSSGLPGITAAEAFRPAMPLEPRRRLPSPTAMIALALVAAVGLLIYLLVSGGPGSGRSAAGSAPASHAPRPRASAGRTPAPKPASSVAARAAVTLTPASATAFGPDGASQGDNQSLAALAIDNSTGTSWQTDWYSTADFSGLQQGTGLLLDLGRSASVSSVRLLLGPAAGGAFQIRAGNTPALASLQPVAQASDPGGAVAVPVSKPVAGRYLLIWFTSLPRDSSGTYQASVFSVSLTGTS
jgi:hypothetical protein